MDNQLFRKKSLERISSPEEMHDYLRVTSPRLWMILSAVVILLAGFIVYASTAVMENTMPIRLNLEAVEEIYENETERHTIVSGRLPIAQNDLVAPGMKVRLGTEEGAITFIFVDEEDEVSFIVEMAHDDLNLPDGEYDAELVLESTTPISFLWN